MEKISFKTFRLIFMVFALSICASVTFAGSGDGCRLFIDFGQLKAVNEKQSETTTEEKEAFKGFINEERNISELSELQVTSQNAAVIIRKF